MIVKISQNTENKKFMNVLVSGETWKIIDKKLYARHLRDICRCSSKKELLDLFSELERKLAKGYVYKLLALKGYLKSELKTKLEARKVDSRVIDEVLQECEKQGYLDDQREIGLYIQRSLRKGWGPALIHHKLASKVEGAKAVVQEQVSEEDQRTAIAHWIEKKYAKQDKSDLKTKQKIYRFLRGKGFEDQLIREFLFAD